MAQLHNIIAELRTVNTDSKVKARKLKQILQHRTANRNSFTTGEWVLKVKVKTKKNHPNFEGPFMIHSKSAHDASYHLCTANGKILKGSYNIDRLIPCYTYDGSPLRAVSDVMKSLKSKEDRFMKDVIDRLDAQT